MNAVEIRDLHGMEEFRRAELLQCAVWGAGDRPDPGDLMMVIQAEGGLAGGAFLKGRLVGYVFGFPTASPGVQHSHRLAVLPEMRGCGIGLQLKWYQRRWCLDRGIRHVRWTFDPMRAANASLNIARLGARSNTYYVDYYGEMSGINSGLPSDRLLTDWNLDHPQVVARAEGSFAMPPCGNCLRVFLPADADALIATGGQKAIDAKLALRNSLSDAFARGYRIVGFDTLDRSYLLSKDDG